MGRASKELRATLGEIFGVQLESHRFDARFEGSLRRSLGAHADEFAALVLAECWIDFSGGQPLNQEAVERVIGRVQKRLEREARKTQDLHAGRLEAVAATTTKDPPYDLQAFLGSLTANDLVWFVGRFMDQRPVEELAREMKVPLSTAYHRLKTVRDKFKKYIEQSRE
jgi:hypothetical protein